MRSKGRHVVWPVYFDSAASWEEGRKVPKSLATRNPSVEALLNAAHLAGFKAEVQPGVAYPKHPYAKTGLLLVEADMPKRKILKEMGKNLPRTA